MKKNNKNKNTKILITSLLCGLSFTCVSVNAMQNSDSEEEKQQISQESNGNLNGMDNFNNMLKMQHIHEQKLLSQKLFHQKQEDKHFNKAQKYEEEIIKELEEYRKKAQDYINAENCFLAEFFIKEIEEKLNEESSNLNELTIKYYEEEITRLNKEFENIKEREKIIKITDKYFDSILEKLNHEEYDLAIKNITYVNRYIESKKQYLKNRDMEKLNEDMKYLKEKLKTNIDYELKRYFKDAFDKIDMGDIDNTKIVMDKILAMRSEKYRTYFNDEEDIKYYKNYKELMERIDKEIKKQAVIKDIKDCCKKITLDIELAEKTLEKGPITSASKKINEMENLVEKNKQILGMFKTNEFRNMLEEFKENLGIIIKEVEKKGKF